MTVELVPGAKLTSVFSAMEAAVNSQNGDIAALRCEQSRSAFRFGRKLEELQQGLNNVAFNLQGFSADEEAAHDRQREEEEERQRMRNQEMARAESERTAMLERMERMEKASQQEGKHPEEKEEEDEQSSRGAVVAAAAAEGNKPVVELNELVGVSSGLTPEQRAKAMEKWGFAIKQVRKVNIMRMPFAGVLNTRINKNMAIHTRIERMENALNKKLPQSVDAVAKKQVLLERRLDEMLDDERGHDEARKPASSSALPPNSSSDHPAQLEMLVKEAVSDALAQAAVERRSKQFEALALGAKAALCSTEELAGKLRPLKAAMDMHEAESKTPNKVSMGSLKSFQKKDSVARGCFGDVSVIRGSIAATRKDFDALSAGGDGSAQPAVAVAKSIREDLLSASDAVDAASETLDEFDRFFKNLLFVKLQQLSDWRDQRKADRPTAAEATTATPFDDATIDDEGLLQGQIDALKSEVASARASLDEKVNGSDFARVKISLEGVEQNFGDFRREYALEQAESNQAQTEQHEGLQSQLRRLEENLSSRLVEQQLEEEVEKLVELFCKRAMGTTEGSAAPSDDDAVPMMQRRLEKAAKDVSELFRIKADTASVDDRIDKTIKTTQVVNDTMNVSITEFVDMFGEELKKMRDGHDSAIANLRDLFEQRLHQQIGESMSKQLARLKAETRAKAPDNALLTVRQATCLSCSKPGVLPASLNTVAPHNVSDGRLVPRMSAGRSEHNWNTGLAPPMPAGQLNHGQPLRGQDSSALNAGDNHDVLRCGFRMPHYSTQLGTLRGQSAGRVRSPTTSPESHLQRPSTSNAAMSPGQRHFFSTIDPVSNQERPATAGHMLKSGRGAKSGELHKGSTHYAGKMLPRRKIRKTCSSPGGSLMSIDIDVNNRRVEGIAMAVTSLNNEEAAPWFPQGISQEPANP